VSSIAAKAGKEAAEHAGQLERSAAHAVDSVERPPLERLELPDRTGGSAEDIATRPPSRVRVTREALSNAVSPALPDVPVQSLRLVVSIPRDVAEFARVYSVAASAADEAHMYRYADKARAGSAATSLADLRMVLSKSAPDDVLVVVAHSEDHGRTLVLPSGERLAIATAHGECATARRRCVFLTCYSPDLGLTAQISPDNALDMWETAAEYARQRPSTLQELTVAMRRDLGLRRTGRYVAVSTVVATAAGAAVELSTIAPGRPPDRRRGP
jgi:hypothetical protein